MMTIGKSPIDGGFTVAETLTLSPTVLKAACCSVPPTETVTESMVRPKAGVRSHTGLSPFTRRLSAITAASGGVSYKNKPRKLRSALLKMTARLVPTWSVGKVGARTIT
eukprot:1599864-Rhodomonas_salina.1